MVIIKINSVVPWNELISLTDNRPTERVEKVRKKLFLIISLVDSKKLVAAKSSEIRIKIKDTI